MSRIPYNRNVLKARQFWRVRIPPERYTAMMTKVESFTGDYMLKIFSYRIGKERRLEKKAVVMIADLDDLLLVKLSGLVEPSDPLKRRDWGNCVEPMSYD